MANNLKPFEHFGTLALHEGQDPGQWNSKAVVPPISLATTFQQEEPGKHAVSLFKLFLFSRFVVDFSACTVYKLITVCINRYVITGVTQQI